MNMQISLGRGIYFKIFLVFGNLFINKLKRTSKSFHYNLKVVLGKQI